MRLFTEKTVLYSEVNMEYQQMLNIAQKKVLLGYIQQLVIHGIPPTQTLVRSFIEKINRSYLKKNWITQFIQHYSIYLKILYLRNMNNL